MKLNNYSKSSQLIARSSILKQAIVCIAACFFSWSAWATNCYDITGGSIGSSQTICTGGNPAMFTNITSATTGQGTGVKYIWLRYVGASAPASSSTSGVTTISGATGATYDPPAGSVTAKTWFRRCSAPNSSWCSTYNGETSWVSVSVTTCVNCNDITAGSIGSSQTICTGGDPATFTNTASATTGQGTGVKYIWLRFVGASAPASSTTSGVTTISGATGATYDPPAGSVTAKTWFRRCSAPNSSSCTVYNGETSWVSVSVSAPTALTCEASINGTWSTLSSCSVSACTGNSLWLSVNPNVSTVTWTGPNGFTASGNDALISNSVTTANAGTYTAALTQNGCTSTTTIQVTITSCGVNCNDITAGSIGSNQSICTGGDPAIINSLTAATTGQGTGVKYIWLRFVGASAPASSTTSGVTTISGATGATYDPPAGSVTAKTWFRRCSAPNSASCTVYNGETSWVSVDVTNCGGNCSSITNVYQVTNTHDNCGTNCADYMMLLPNNGGCFLANNVYLTEYNNNTAILQGTATNSSGTVATINVTLSGKTCTGTPHYALCINSGGGSWCYYTTMTGTVTVTGIGNINIASYMHPFQMGAGANLQDNLFGGSGWFTTNGSTANAGDFNIRLTSVAALSASASSVCTGTSSNITLNVSGGRPTYTYLWSNGATSQNLSGIANGSYTVTITDANGCTTTAATTANCGANCSDITGGSIGNNQTICTGGDPIIISSLINATTTYSGGVKYLWKSYVGASAPASSSSTGVTTVSGATGATYDPPAGSVTAKTWFRRCAAPNSTSCTAYSGESNWISIDVTTVSASIAGTTAICSGGSTTLTASGGGTYVWSTGSTTAAITVNPTANTTYTVTVTNGGCTATATKAVTVGAVSASIAGTTAICSGGSTTLTASGGGTYVWSTGSTTAAITVNPTANTTYTVTVTNGGCTATATRAVTITGPITSGITSPTTTCALEPVLVQAQNVDATCTYSWNFGVNATPQTATGTSATTQFSAAAVGTAQTITLTVTKNGCSATFTKNINVTPEVFANAGPDKEICQGGSTQIGGSPAGPAGGTFTWSPNTFLNSNTVANPIASPPVTTTYTLTTTLNGCTRTDQVVVSVNVALNPNANAGGSKTVCSGQSVQIGGNPTSTNTGVSYVWSPANSLSGAYVSNPTAYPTTNTTYTVTVTNTATGCSATSSAAVTVTSCVTPALSINDITVTEGTNPTATLQICTSATSTSPITVTYTTSNGTALSGTDYTTTTATATIPAGQTCVNVTIPIIDDAINEPTENFTVTLTNPSNATIADGTGIVTILDNDTAPCIANINITGKACNNNGTPSNPNDDTYTFVMTVVGAGTGSTWSGGYSNAYLGAFAFGPTPYNTPITLGPFAAGPFTPSNVVPPIIVPNGVDISINVTDSQNTSCTASTVVTSTGPCSNVLPSVTINDITVTEGTNPTATLQICTSATSGSPITVTYTTSNGTAMMGTDYTTTTATATIPAGQTCVNVTIPIIDDAVNEPTETFNVTLTNPTNATIADPLGVVTILDNDVTTAITIGDKVFFDANNNGIQDGGSEVGLPGVTVNLYNATGGWLGSSTTNANGLYSFSSTTIPALVAGSYRVCFNKPWNYSNVSPKDQGTDDAIDSDANAFSGGSACTDLFTVVAGETKNTIDLGLNNATTPTIPSLSINDVEVNENAGTATLQICASATSTSPITVTYTTSNGTALSGTDYTTTTATATIPAGQTCVNVTIPIVDDAINEPTETFTVILSTPTGATINDGTGVVTILDNDNPIQDVPSLSINDITVTEGTNPTATLQICASATSTSPITVTYTTSNGTAMMGTDYTTTTATATIPAGQTCVNVTIPIIDDAINEPTETFTVTLTNPSNAVIGDGTGIVTILDNDPTGSTTITIGDKVFFDANNNGIQDGGSEVGLPGVTVNLFNTTGGWMGSSTTNANGLYSFSSTTISSLVPGSYRVCFNKPWNYSNVSPKDQGTDDAIDSDVNAFLSGSACTDLFTVAAGETKNTIDAGLNNGVTPTLPTLSINDITVNESPGNATLQICASATSTSPITVTYTTSNGTAIAGSDYTSTTATATIPAGQTCVAVNVPILDDNIGEPTETFTVTLTNPTGATINDGTGIVTILDNDVNCNDITGGSISGNQTICTGGDPAAINSISPSTTSFSGGVKYQWFSFVGANPPASMASATQIIGATNASYDPPAGSVTAKKWFRRCAAPNSATCTVFAGESAWVSVDVTTCTGNTCANITNVYQVQNTLDNCGASCTNAPYMMILFNQGGCYTANNVYLTEYNDGTAKLQGTATNNTGLVATIDVTLSGKTCTGTPYYALCTSGGGAAWCYYATMSGTISVTGFPVMNISSFMHPFQMGNGANLQSNAFGASGWFSSNGVDNQGDFNFELVSVTSVAVTTNSVCTGSTSTITANATGGRPTYTYAWSNGATTASINNAANGTYTVTVTDANGCTATSSITTNCSTGGTCDNATTAGSLGYYQSGVAPFDPSAIVETAAPTGGSGAFQYIWQSSSDNWNWTTITGATSVSYDPTAITTSTFYRRGVRRANCTEYIYSHSVYKEVVGSGKTELAANAAAINNLTVAPVPAIDYINVLFDAATEQMVNVRVLDITGRLAITQNLITTQGSNLVSFDVTQLLPGYYIVELNNGTTKQHAKFVVMR